MAAKDLFSLREDEIFSTLKALKNCDFALIGGYAVNAYTLPRFSVDCDIVTREGSQLTKIEKILSQRGYKKAGESPEIGQNGGFSRYEKRIENNFSVSVDILIKGVIDRMTGTVFSAEWIFENSKREILKGKTINEELKLKIINIDALIAMKIISCRATDIRDVFMMLPSSINREWIKTEVSSRHNFRGRTLKILEKVNSKQFKDGLSGVYGRFDQKTFEKHRKMLQSLLD